MVRQLGNGVSAINAEIGTSDVFAGIAEQESDGTHEVFGSSHLTLRDEGGPLAVKFGVLLEDLLCTVEKKTG